ncbi:hybrid sensor histidine kinase/response regulator [Massilia sp. TN1-12]|uniref:hybrid sensor histidine kinase/response regulator n=1 Tax=Massilia paldalensis TaxID=3377675 RepID=UPI00384D0EF8
MRDVSAQVSTERALRESERNFRLMADSVPQIIWIVMASGEAVYFNRQWDDYTGAPIASSTPADVANQHVHPDDQAHTMAAWEHAYARGEAFDVEHRIRSRTGEYRWFLVRAEPFFDSAGAIDRWFGTSTDIHEETMRKMALEREERRRSFELTLADRIRPLLDPEEVTAVACELLGKALGGKRVVYGEADDTGAYLALKRDWTDGTLASMGGMRLRMDDFGAAVADILRSGRNLVIDDVMRVDEALPHVANYMASGIRSVLAIPLVKDGRLRAVLSVHDDEVHAWSPDDIGMAEDMVDRTRFAVESARFQHELRTERDQSQEIFRSMAEGFALLDSDGTLLQINDIGAQLSRLPSSELLGKHVLAAMPCLQGSEIETLCRRVQAQSGAGTLEYRQVLHDGTGLWLEIRAYPLPEQRLAVFFRDIGERKAIEEQLRDAARRKDDFLAMLAHELRNPLAPIGAAAHLLRLGRLDTDRLRQTSEIIGRQVDHMTHLINDLLDVSRVTRGLVELENARVDLRNVVIDAAEQVTPLIQGKRHALHTRISPESALVMGDKKRLVQVVANILNNAAKYTPDGGVITLGLDVRADGVVIDVADNGIGMSADLTSHVFELFTQAERTPDRSAGGLGLGLALVKSIVELHGGEVTCHSDGPGQGSRFSVWLPRLDGESGSAAAGTSPRASRRTASALRILVVDDNVDAAAMLGTVLESEGHHVAVEVGSRAALARARVERPQVCLLDIGLPEIDGNELAMRLRAQPETAGAVLIAVSGYGHDSDRRQSLAAGFSHHLVKPVDPAHLIDILAEIAANQGEGGGEGRSEDRSNAAETGHRAP